MKKGMLAKDEDGTVQLFEGFQGICITQDPLGDLMYTNKYTGRNGSEIETSAPSLSDLRKKYIVRSEDGGGVERLGRCACIRVKFRKKTQSVYVLVNSDGLMYKTVKVGSDGDVSYCYTHYPEEALPFHTAASAKAKKIELRDRGQFVIIETKEIEQQ